MFEPSKLFEVVGEPILPLVVKKADPWTLEHLAEWIATKNPNGWYDPGSIHSCLLCQYASHVVGEHQSWLEARTVTDFWDRPDHEAWSAIAHDTEGPNANTFGAALTRAQAALERLPRSFLQAEGGK